MEKDVDVNKLALELHPLLEAAERAHAEMVSSLRKRR